MREGSVSRDGCWVGYCQSTNAPQHKVHILHTIILTPEGDVTSSTHIRGSWVGLSEDHGTCTGSNITEVYSTMTDYTAILHKLIDTKWITHCYLFLLRVDNIET